jgi:MOSC domain-containing protein YiiM
VTGGPLQIERFVVSCVHRLAGRPADGPTGDPADDPVADAIRLRAGLGVVGDRYFNRPAHRDASVTLIAAEALEAVAGELGVPPFDPAAARRTIVLRGLGMAATQELIGTGFSLDSGDGPVRFAGRRAANPCAWMDVVLAPGAFRALRGRGGVRAVPLTDGRLTLGPVVLRTDLDQT